MPISYQLIQPGKNQGHLPVMLETTATVHPGASGGVVVNLDGHMIGLVTRYNQLDSANTEVTVGLLSFFFFIIADSHGIR